LNAKPVAEAAAIAEPRVLADDWPAPVALAEEAPKENPAPVLNIAEPAAPAADADPLAGPNEKEGAVEVDPGADDVAAALALKLKPDPSDDDEVLPEADERSDEPVTAGKAKLKPVPTLVEPTGRLTELVLEAADDTELELDARVALVVTVEPPNEN